MAEWQMQGAIVGLKNSICDMNNVRYVNIIKVVLFKVTSDQLLKCPVIGSQCRQQPL
jgi:sialic acid synthase SpsE